ncbi:MAG: MarR family transcriptional regulator [Pseudomonadota bacterium]
MNNAANGNASPTSILHLLHRASQSADDLLSNKLGDVLLTPRQFTVLEAVANASEVSQTALVDITGIDRSTLADIVKRLVDAGFLKRERTVRDARMYAVQLTDAGRETLDQARPIAHGVASAVLDPVSQEDRDRLIAALDVITQTLGPVASARVSARAKSLIVQRQRVDGSEEKTAASGSDTTDATGHNGTAMKPQAACA